MFAGKRRTGREGEEKQEEEKKRRRYEKSILMLGGDRFLPAR